MQLELTKLQKCTESTYHSDGRRTECVREARIFYVEGMPAFMILENGEMDPITPDGMCIYSNNKKECDEWLKKNFAGMMKWQT